MKKELLIGVLTLLMLASCGGSKSKVAVGTFDESHLSNGEQMILAALHDYDFKRVTLLADSLVKTGDISAVAADYYRGGAAVHKGLMREARQYLRRATADSVPDASDMRLYLRARSLLARVLTTEGDFENALNEALPTLTMMDSLGNNDFGDMTQLLIVVGECQQNLHMATEVRIDNISSSYINTSEYAQAKTWLEREDSALAVYKTKPDVVEKQADMLRGSISLDLAEVCQQLGQSKEAARHYARHRKTIFSSYNLSRINACDYLMAAGHYQEAATNYEALDQMFEKRDYELSLDNIGQYLLPKMKANVLAGRKDTATPKVSHVGFYLGDGKFIHSLGLVKIGSFRPEDPEYDAYNTGRYLFASRVLPFIDKQEGLNTTMTNPYYLE